jgi:beta-mannosidase
MLNDPAPAISWSVVDWRRRPKAAYEVLAAAMSPVLICSEYPKEAYRLGRGISLSFFVVNDLARGLGRLCWSWELHIEGDKIARDYGEAEIAAGSVTRMGRARARLPIPGRATLQLRLYGEGIEATNAYDFFVSDDAALSRGPSAPGR